MTTISNVEQIYKDSVEFLDEHYAYFLTHVLNIGHPIWSAAEVDTACVALPDKDADVEDFMFIFNPDFAGELDVEGFSFILAHETMHIVLNHLSLAKRFDNHMIFNIAADCVINDYLDNAGFEPIEGVMRGENVVGFNCANSTVTEVYNLIEAKCDELAEAMEEFLEGLAGGSMKIDDHGWMHDEDIHQQLKDALSEAMDAAEDEMPSDAEQLRDETKNTYANDQYGLKPGDKDGGARTFMEENSVSLNWVELLKKVDPDLFREKGAGPRPLTSFRRPRRKLMSMYPDVIVPIYDEPDKEPTARSNFKPSIVMALDTSDSIGQATANRFINLAKSIPQDKIDLRVITFTNSVKEQNLDSPVYIGGGTAFSPIENFIRNKVMPANGGQYPKAVVVITDGEANFASSTPSDEHRKNWTWLICKSTGYYGYSPSYATSYVNSLKGMFGDDRVLLLKDFVN